MATKITLDMQDCLAAHLLMLDMGMEKIRASKDSHNISVIYWTNLNWRTKKIYRRLSLRILKDVLRYEKSGRPCKE